MYVEFRLPSGAGGQAAAYCNQLITRELEKWADKHQIIYNTKIHKYTLKLTFTDLETYSFFALTWNPSTKIFQSYLNNYRMVEPMDPPKSN